MSTFGLSYEGGPPRPGGVVDRLERAVTTVKQLDPARIDWYGFMRMADDNCRRADELSARVAAMEALAAKL